MTNQRAPAVVTLPGEIDLYNREQAYNRTQRPDHGRLAGRMIRGRPARRGVSS